MSVEEGKRIFYKILGFVAALLTLLFIGVIFEKSLSGKEAFEALIGLVGGLSIFLYGIELLSSMMRKIAGAQMRKILSRFGKNIFLATAGGIVLTVIFQSSSATTVLLVSFVEAELLSAVKTVGVIIGANIGKTVTTQLIAFKLTNYSLIIITAGFLLRILTRKRRHRMVGLAIIGVGFLFFGMHIMSTAMMPLRSSEWFQHAILSIGNPILGILVGTFFTAIIQSSAAFTGIVIALAQGGLISLESSIPLIFGANIGTCVTAFLASMQRSRDARRVAIIHIVFNITGALIFAFFIPQLAQIVRFITPDTGNVAVYLPRQIANAHTLFNLMAALLFLPASSFLVKAAFLIIPRRKEEIPVTFKTKYLDRNLLSTPTLSIERARLELTHLGAIVEEMLKDILVAFRKCDRSLVDSVVKRDDQVDFLIEEINSYISDILKINMEDREVEECQMLLNLGAEMDHIADTIETNISRLCYRRIQENLWFSDDGIKELEMFHRLVIGEYQRALSLIKSPDIRIVHEMKGARERIRNVEERLREVHFRRLQNGVQETIRTHQMHMDILDQLRIINSYIGRMVDYENRYLKKYTQID